MIINSLTFILLNSAVTQSSEIISCGLNTFARSYNFFILQNGVCYNMSAIPDTNLIISTGKIFQKYRNDVILLRVISGSGISSYNYYVTSTNFDNSIDGNERNLKQNFKSPLLQEWDNLRPIQIKVTLKDNDNKVLAWLTFRVQKTDDLISWFAKSNLVASTPWILANAKSPRYSYFSIPGNNQNVKRSFHISLPDVGDCSDDYGMLAVYDETPDACSYVKNSVIPVIAYAETDGGQPSYFINDIKYAHSLEMTAIYHEDIAFFTQV